MRQSRELVVKFDGLMGLARQMGWTGVGWGR
jgi:hypothetical protein